MNASQGKPKAMGKEVVCGVVVSAFVGTWAASVSLTPALFFLLWMWIFVKSVKRGNASYGVSTGVSVSSVCS